MKSVYDKIREYIEHEIDELDLHEMRSALITELGLEKYRAFLMKSLDAIDKKEQEDNEKNNIL